MAKMDNFSDMILRLQGVKVTEEARVPRETIIDILREHTMMIREIRKDLNGVMHDMGSVRSEAIENRKQMAESKVQVDETITLFKIEAEKGVDDIKKILKLNFGFQKQMDTMNSKLNEFPTIKNKAIEQENKVDIINMRMELQAEELVNITKKSAFNFSNLEEKTDELQSKMKILRQNLDGLGDNLVISANQITVASSAGYSNKPMMLFDLLRNSNTTMNSVETNLAAHHESIAGISETLSKKADESVIFDVNILMGKVKGIDDMLKAEEDQGMSGLRKTCEVLERNFDMLEAGMSEKVGIRQMDSAVHKKYEEIIQYLKQSLQATGDDEKNFKNKIEDFRLQVQKLSNSKADRFEITPMQEMLVKAQAQVQKLEVKEKERQDTLEQGNITKKEVDLLLERKVNKLEFQQQIEGIMKSLKKHRKLVALSAGISDNVVDESQQPHMFTTTSMAIHGKPQQPQEMRTQSRDERETSSSGKRFSTSNIGEFAAYIKREKGARNSPPHQRPPEAGMNDDMSDETGAQLMTRPWTSKGSLEGRPLTSPAYADRPLEPLKNSANSANLGANLKKRPSTSVNSKGKGPNSKDNKGDFSHLGGATLGSGFNVRSQSPLPEGQLGGSSTRLNEVDNEDADLSDAMIRGNDGRFYFTDHYDLGMITPTSEIGTINNPLPMGPTLTLAGPGGSDPNPEKPPNTNSPTTHKRGSKGPNVISYRGSV
mmetsp:Transcript_16052/g.15413  ORF Transcript_16052/g.15413 Transcript_16052/m.15413 type:complete len:714 (-) Transcript_16052:424-2565(-)|eukprot:CAMPEP_0119047838 /NCGR_PEP_ID=MMETSP1177-20130426/55306_1 /TAXON_ID=2985 /ORGANISM="Ochromonas sp, Strain CCMP1899" /LENGTH=713 /DNA_ID=CAMNT_0007022917 /DNA_START=97 /DNA_END=2238 /DNA_ORIENTATION=-